LQLLRSMQEKYLNLKTRPKNWLWRCRK